MILFLDFDGVLHPEYILGISPGRFKNNQEHFIYLPNLEKLLREFADLEVVISSTWREGRSLADLQGLFSLDLRHRIVGTTPKLHQTESRRHREIEAWLQEQGRLHESWIALDDWPPLFNQVCENVFFTETLTGLDEETTERLREWIKMQYLR